jgi:glutamyl/glutaminyl-tRNA synthetase
MTTARLNPTLNGLPHLGHAYLALTNQHAARSTGGKFYFRGEDDQTAWLKIHTAQQMREFGEQWMEDMFWLGIEFDGAFYESDMMVSERIRDVWPDAQDTGVFPPVMFPTVVGSTHDWYPYTRYLTAKVRLLDSMLGVDMLIVGMDLLPRFALYSEVSILLGLPLIPQIFLPRLRGKGELDDVKKTNGTHRIAAYRDAGWKPQEVVKLLRMSCLDDPDGDWDWRNIKASPQVVI